MKSDPLTRRIWRVLQELPGDTSVQELAQLSGATSKAKVREALTWLDEQGLIRLTEVDSES